MRRTFSFVASAAMVTLAVGCRTPAPATAAQGVNVLFLAVDDLRPELGCYGVAHAVTPNLDRLAARGVRFARAYCQSAVCNPSRASVMTGLRPDTVGVLDLQTDLRKVAPDVVTLPQHLRAHGYHTASIGKIYHNIFPDEPSWDERCYLPGFPFDPDAVYVGEEGLRIQAERRTRLIADGRGESAKDRFGHYYLKAQATEAPDCTDTAYYDGAQTDWAIAKLAELAGASQPFMLAVGYYRPHLPFNAPKRYWDLYDPASLPLATPGTVTEGAPREALNNLRELRGYTDFRQQAPPPARLPDADQRRLLHGYLASVSYVDAQVGRLLTALEHSPAADRTVVVLWSDHGWKLGEHGSWAKMTNYEIDTRVPLLIAGPDLPRGAVRTQLVELLDLYPTLCALCGVPPPAGLQGTSLVPVLHDAASPGKDAVFTVFLRKGAWAHVEGEEHMGRAVRDDRYRYVEWRKLDGAGGGTPSGVELYDLQADPGELVNVAGRAPYAAVEERLRAVLHAAKTSR